MELKKTYTIKDISTGKIICKCDDYRKARKALQNILLDRYNKYLNIQEKNDGDFKTYWQWYYDFNGHDLRNGKAIGIYEIVK